MTRVNTERLQVAIIGEAPLISNRFNHKIRRDGRLVGSPVDLFNGTRYRLKDGSDGVPALALKQCIADGLRKMIGIPASKSKATFWVIGDDRPDGYDLCRIIAPFGAEMRVDKVALGNGDSRYRAQFWPWAIDFFVEYMPVAVSRQQLLQAIAIAGQTVGLLEWRPGSPSHGGPYGTFRLGTLDEVKQVGAAQVRPPHSFYSSASAA